ncbi:MAG: putative lipid II flippase FtsW, partial [Elusimicrobia bacterium]|nr:putative lipid II flippase FtsW [Elusimicrobiota bacterium]
MISSRRMVPAVDYPLVILVCILMGFGLVMLYSSSAIWAEQHFKDSTYFLKKQIFWMMLGTMSLFYFSHLNYNRLREWVFPVLILMWVCLVAVLFTPSIGGARRWIRFGPLGIQPAEMAKLVVLLFLADYIDRKKSKLTPWGVPMVVPFAILGMTLGLILLERDLGTPVLMFLVGLILLFIGGVKPLYLIGAVASSIPLLAYEIFKYPYRIKRFLNFFSPWDDPQGAGYQLVQALLAVGSGGWWGKGLGSSSLKLMYLPAPHTDFIFSVVCEELGFMGSLGVLCLFSFFFIRGIRIAKMAPNLFGTLLAGGIVFSITLQAFFNIAVSLGLLPTKGLPLPF